MITVKTQAELALMREAGLVVAHTLDVVRRAVEPGVSTADLDAIAERTIREAGAVPSFLGYRGFPATLCTSVNEEIVHGIPRPDVVLREGDLVSIDCGAIVGGFHGDAAVTVPVGPVPAALETLLAATEEALWLGIGAARAGGRVADISRAIERHLRSFGYGVVEEYTGHGIGRSLHEDPAVPNLAGGGRGPRLVEGMALAVEPMANLGTHRTRTLADDWTVVTADGAPSAHFEHTFALTADGPWVLTAVDGGAGRLASAVA